MTKEQLKEALIGSISNKGVLKLASHVFTRIGDDVIVLKSKYTKEQQENLNLSLSHVLSSCPSTYEIQTKCANRVVFIDESIFNDIAQIAINEYKAMTKDVDNMDFIGSFSAEGKSKFIVATIEDKENEMKDKIAHNSKTIEISKKLIQKLERENQLLHGQLGGLKQTKKVFGGE